MRAKLKIQYFIILIICFLFFQGSTQNHEFIPLSSGGSGISSDSLSPFNIADPVSIEPVNFAIQPDNGKDKKTGLNDFLSKVVDGKPGIIRGVYSEDNFALPIIQQPSGQTGFVSNIDGVVTQFSLPNQYGVTGLIAHNFLSGKKQKR